MNQILIQNIVLTCGRHHEHVVNIKYGITACIFGTVYLSGAFLTPLRYHTKYIYIIKNEKTWVYIMFFVEFKILAISDITLQHTAYHSLFPTFLISLNYGVLISWACYCYVMRPIAVSDRNHMAGVTRQAKDVFLLWAPGLTFNSIGDSFALCFKFTDFVLLVLMIDILTYGWRILFPISNICCIWSQTITFWFFNRSICINTWWYLFK